MKQTTEYKSNAGLLVRLVRPVVAVVSRHIDRLVAMRAFDDRRYDFTRSGK